MTIKTKLIIWSLILLVVLSLGVYYWLIKTGRIETGAEAIIGCQGSNKISEFLGPPGANLISYNLFGNQVTIHQELVPYLDKIQKEVNDAKTGYNFTNISTFNMRSKVGGRGRSLHSWGIAIDINPESNPYEPGNFGPPETDIPGKVIDIFKKYGFAWGGDWPGERDPMHLEWYGAEINGQILDKTSSQKIISVATDIDGAGSPNFNGDFHWLVPFGSHTITSKARGYKDNSFTVSLACFSETTMNIGMEALPSNVAGSISGRVRLVNNYPLLMPTNIYLDDRLVGASNLRGDFTIPNVHEGKHKVTAKIMFSPGVSTDVVIVPGENLKDVSIVIGK